MRVILVATFVVSTAVAPAGRSQQSAPMFDGPTVAVLTDLRRLNRIADLDGDAHPDAVGYYQRTDNQIGVFGYRNDGQGGLEYAWETVFPFSTLPSDPVGFDAGDMNADGRDDIALAANSKFAVVLNADPSPPATLYVDTIGPAGNRTIDCVIGDFNGDAIADVALLTQQDLRVYYALLSMSSAALVLPLASTPEATLHVVDANGDGVDDMLVSDQQALTFYSANTGSIAPLASHTHGLAGVHVVLSDFDGDLDEDVVVFGDAGTFRVLRRTGPAMFVLEPAKAGGPATDLADVDQDGVLDALRCRQVGFGPANDFESRFEISLGDGQEGFGAPFEMAALGAQELAGAVDLDSDGDVDLVAGRVVFYNQGGFRPIAVAADGPAFSGPGDAAAMVDLDGDGDPDARFAVDDARTNLGDGRFVTVSHVAATPPAGGTFVGPGFPIDFDADGDVDLIVEHYAGGAFVSMRRLENNGGGGLSDAGPAAAPGVKFALTVDASRALARDFTGDGVPDLVIGAAPGEPAGSQLYRNDGAGFFSTWFGFVGDQVKWVGDATGDGIADLISLGDTVHLRRGIGGGFFQAFESLQPVPPPAFQYQPASDKIAIADFDNDGDVDIVAIHRELFVEGVAHLLENTGSGTFVDHEVFLDHFLGAARAYGADFDGDGLVDLALGEYRDTIGSYSIFRQTSAPGLTFEFRGVQFLRASGFEDVDGDGDADALSDIVTKCVVLRSPDAGEREQFGVPTPGTGGQAPVLGASGPFRFGETPTLRMSGVAPNAFGLFVFGLATGELPNAPVYGTTLYVWPIAAAVPIPFPGDQAELGSGRLSVSFNVPAAAVGVEWYHQIFAADAGAVGGASASNALRLYYGP